MNIFGYNNHYSTKDHRTAWSVQIGKFRIVEWPWSGWRVQFGRYALNCAYGKKLWLDRG